MQIMKGFRWKTAASCLFGAGLLACGEDGSSSATSPDAGADTGSAADDPFCRTRPRLAFCEDFDEAASLPARFSRIEGKPEIVSIEAHPDAPSGPNALRVASTATATDARLVLEADKGVKYNLFFFVRLEPGHGRVEIAGLEDGDYRLALGVEADGKWYVEEHPGPTDGGVPAPRTLATDVAPELSTFSSVRFDVYVDGAGLGHLRFRSGNDVVFLSEPLTFGDGKATLTPTLYVGARIHAGTSPPLWFDSVTLGEE
jgi:hypothetical protein